MLVAAGNGVLYLLCCFVTTLKTADRLPICYEIHVVTLFYCAATLDTKVPLIFCVVHD